MYMDIWYYGMDVPTLNLFLRPILTVTSVWNTGETGDINMSWAGFESGNHEYLLLEFAIAHNPTQAQPPRLVYCVCFVSVC